MKVQPSEPLMILTAHPDETIATTTVMRRSQSVRIVNATDGAPIDMVDAYAAGFRSREEYARRRKEELHEALCLAGVCPTSVITLPFTDQQLAFHLCKLTRQIADQLQEFQPSLVLTHAYEGGHPDHDSVAFATHMALELYRAENPGAQIQLWEFPLYHSRWGKQICGEFIPMHGVREERHLLNPEQVALKHEILRCFQTQRKSLEPFFALEQEVFRPAPHYDFARAPHLGKLYYERYDWGVDGPTWRALATQTILALQPEKAVS